MLSENTKHILIVEDAEDIRVLLSSFLEVSGFKVDCAEDGEDALRLLRAMPAQPDLILLDLMMPDMDGFEFRRVQVADAQLAKIPILVMSADNHIRTKIIGMGAAGYSKKPFTDLELILKTVNESFAHPDEGYEAAWSGDTANPPTLH